MRGALVLTAVLCFMLVGCASSSGLAGKWQSSRSILEFGNDGHVKIASSNPMMGFSRGYTWYKVDGDKMTVGHLQSGVPDETVSFKLEGDTLTIGSCMALGTMGATKFRRAK